MTGLDRGVKRGRDVAVTGLVDRGESAPREEAIHWRSGGTPSSRRVEMYVIPRGRGGGGEGKGERGKGEVCCSAKGQSELDELGPYQGAVRVIEGGPVRIPTPEPPFLAAGSVR